MEEEVKVKDKKKTMLICSITVVALVLIVGISYAFWQLTKVQEDTNIISSGCFGVELVGNEAINLSSQYPIKTEEGMNTTPYTFTITNTCSGSANYIVNLESLAETTFNNSSIRVALNDSNKLYSEYSESNKYYSDSIEARTLISGTLENNGSVTYNLRMWIDENAPATEQNKIFASKIVVTSGQEGEGIDPEITDLNATSTTDSINITYQANGDITPAICKYGIEEGTYDNTVADATATNCNITGLNENTTYYYQVCTETGKGSKCVNGKIKTLSNYKISEHVEIGDYISMTPTSTSYTISTATTGYTSDQAINPSELNLWRVIRKNSDGTVDMVSEYVSSTLVYFRGANGYLNLVGGLNTIASQYTDGVHVASSRHMGYSNQTEKCTALSTSACPSDTGYQTDLELVNVAYGGSASCISSCAGLKAYKAGTTTYGSYWVASRAVSGTSTNATYNGFDVLTGGTLSHDLLTSDSGSNYSYYNAVRPIITIKADTLIVSGDGQSEGTAYTLD